MIVVSTWPRAPRASVTNRSMLASRERSRGSTRTSSPALSRSLWQYVTTSREPAARKRSTIAPPILDDAPMITTLLGSFLTAMTHPRRPRRPPDDLLAVSRRADDQKVARSDV